MKYRAEIDGLRALAVVPVILFHAGFELFSGGYVGVDVFFVISGYLITTILVEDIENNRFSLVNFYERRARRILPALFFVMLMCIPFAWMLMQPSQMKDFSQSLVAVSLFASNVLFWRESGYFDAAAEEKPLLHTWSLAVEEQYYVLFPIFLFLAWRYGKNRVFWMIVVMASISLLLSEWGWRNKPTANFYLAPARAWELLAGSIAAFVVQKRGVQNNDALSFLGLGAIIFAIFAYDETTPFPSLYALVPVLGVVLLVLYADKDTLAAKLLSTKAFVGIGLISYSAYLWHQPLFAFARIRQVGLPSDIVMILLSLVSMIFAYFSWKFIENGFRNKLRIRKKLIFLISFLGFFAFVLFGLFGHYKGDYLNAGKWNPYNLALGAYISDNRSLQKESWNLLRELSNDKNYTVEDNEFDDRLWFDLSMDSQRLFLIGNSHSKDIFNILSQSDLVLSQFQVARYGAKISDLNSHHRMWSSKNYAAATHIVIATRYSDKDLDRLSMTVEKMLNDKKRVFIVKSIFEFPGEASGYSLIDKVVYQNANLTPPQISSLVNRAYFDYYKSSTNNPSRSSNLRLMEISERYNVPLLNRMDYVCDDAVEQCFAVDDDLSKNFYDYGHHTLSGSTYFSNSVLLPKFLMKLTDIDNNE
ncbi:acyltransferase [Pseudomonadales bacterium]|nr:acyltransferase [Pseudomonadales bacterium]